MRIARPDFDIRNRLYIRLIPLVLAGLLFSLAYQGSALAGTRRARHLRAAPECDGPGEPVVYLRWRAAARGAQRVDTTKFFRGFQTGDYERGRRLDRGVERLKLRDVETGIHYQWRVMTRRGGRWLSSKIGEFDGPVCVEDTNPRGAP